jgi:Holliday junction DNA helicase RuvA
VIGFLRGTLIAKRAPSLLVDVGGVGYEVDAPMSTFFKLPDAGAEVTLFTHLVVREDAHMLFGFSSEDERALFRSLIKVSGIGARLALGILSGLSADEFHRCVLSEDTARLVRLPGIGKKTAERLIIEMRDRLPQPVAGSDAVSATIRQQPQGAVDEAISALVALGFRPAEAAALVRTTQSEGKSSEDLIRSALQAAAK